MRNTHPPFQRDTHTHTFERLARLRRPLDIESWSSLLLDQVLVVSAARKDTERIGELAPCEKQPTNSAAPLELRGAVQKPTWSEMGTRGACVTL